MASLEIFQFAYNADNYGVLLHCPDSGDTACIDAGDASATEAVLAQTGWSLTHLFITHHHGDHTAGLSALKAAHNAHVIGPPPRSAPISGIDSAVWDGDSFDFATHQVQVIATPGHTLDMINFYLHDEKIVFTGDTLFALGCGRVFEGSFDKTFNLDKQKYSLTYYLDVGDQNCKEPGILKMYDPYVEILPSEGTIVIIPAFRKHSATYDGKKDRVMIGVNFYSII